MSKKSFVGGALILMAAGFVVRILGFVYRIYLSNLIGAEGMGLFQLISPVYSLDILTLTSGISIAVSKMVAAELARNHLVNLRRITGCAVAVVVGTGAVISLLMYLNLQMIVTVVLKDSRTYYAMLLLIPCIPVIAASSALKGYFYGIQQVVPTAFSQIAEQVVRILLVMAMAAAFVKTGLEYACALATIGTAAGEIANLLVLFVFYSLRKRKSKGPLPQEGFLRKRRIIREIIGISVPVSSNRFITSIMSAVEYILIPQQLVAGGLGYQNSIEVYGRLTGMAMPLIYFPCLVTSSLATTLVPAISEAISLRNYRSVNYRISKSIQITFILGFIFTTVFLTLPHEISSIVYKREKVGDLLYMLAFACIFIYLQQTLLGILNGLGKQGISLRNSVIGSAIRISFVYFMIPRYGIQSYVLALAVSNGCVCLLNLITVMRTTGMSIDIRNWVLKPGLVSGIVYLVSPYVYSFFSIFLAGYTWKVLFCIAGNVTVSLMLLVVVGALDREELLKLFGIKIKQNRRKKELSRPNAR